LFTTLKSPESAVERSGAAHGLSEVLMAWGNERVERYLPDILETARKPESPVEVKEGYLGLFVYLPITMVCLAFCFRMFLFLSVSAHS